MADQDDNDDAINQQAKMQALQALQNQPSQTESALRGASQGATMGLGQYPSAALSALVPTATDTAMNRSYGDRFQQSLNDINQQNQTAQQANPKSYLAGQVGGAALPIAASAGLGAGTAGGSAVADMEVPQGATKFISEYTTPSGQTMRAWISETGGTIIQKVR